MLNLKQILKKGFERVLLEHERDYRFNTKKNEFHRQNYLKINNTNLSAKKVAEMIKKEFKL